MIEELLDMLRYEFVTRVHPSLVRQGNIYLSLPGTFDQSFNQILAKWEAKQQ